MNKRPVLYTTTCILSFIGGGVAALSFFSVALFYPFFVEKIIALTNRLSMVNTSPFYFLLLAIAHCCSILSVALLWKYRKNGFFLYLLAQLLIMFLPVFFIDKNSFSVINAIFTSVFCAIYFCYYRWLIDCHLCKAT